MIDPAIKVVIELVALNHPRMDFMVFCQVLKEELVYREVVSPNRYELLVPELDEYFVLYTQMWKSSTSDFMSLRYDTAASMMSYFDSLYIKAVIGSRVVVMSRDTREGVRVLDKRNFLDKHTREKVYGTSPSQPYGAAAYWFKRTETYERVIFDPSPSYVAIPGEFNLWKGFEHTGYKQEDNGKSQSFFDFMENVVCNGNEEYYNFLHKLMCKMIQQPESKKGEGIAVALRGAQGTGKSFFIEHFGKLFGSAFLKVDDTSRLTRSFNSNLMNKILVFGDEAIWGGNKRDQAVLKSLISSETINIEMKYAEPFVMPNYIRLFSATNDDWLAPVEKGNRRWFTLEMSEAHTRDKAYFSAIAKDLEDGGYRDMLHRLQVPERFETDFQHEMPTTATALESLDRGLNPCDQFIKRFIQSNYGRSVDYRQSVKDDTPYVVLSSELYAFYKAYLDDERIQRVESPATLGRSLFKMVPDRQRLKVTVDKHQVQAYSLPRIDMACASAAKHLGVTTEEFKEL